MKKSAMGWVIVGAGSRPYTGWCFTRADMIAQHVDDLYSVGKWTINGSLTPEQEAAWQICRKNGDRAVKAKISLL